MKTTLFIAWITMALACSDRRPPASERTDGYKPDLFTAEDTLFQAVMAGHDAAMAKLGKLKSHRKEALSRVDSLAAHPSAANRQRAGVFRNLAATLQSAETDMNTWMDGFVVDSAQDDKEKRVSYLRTEKEKVNQVKNEVLSSLATADSLFKQ